MPKRTQRMRGKGITDILKSAYNKAVNVFNKARDINTTLKNKRYAGRALEFVPSLASVPYLGNALSTAAGYGYGRKKRVGRPKKY